MVRIFSPTVCMEDSSVGVFQCAVKKNIILVFI